MILDIILVLLGSTAVVCIAGLIIFCIVKLVRHHDRKRSCWPFKYGGFGDDNGYKDWRHK